MDLTPNSRSPDIALRFNMPEVLVAFDSAVSVKIDFLSCYRFLHWKKGHRYYVFRITSWIVRDRMVATLLSSQVGVAAVVVASRSYISSIILQ